MEPKTHRLTHREKKKREREIRFVITKNKERQMQRKKELIGGGEKVQTASEKIK